MEWERTDKKKPVLTIVLAIVCLLLLAFSIFMFLRAQTAESKLLAQYEERIADLEAVQESLSPVTESPILEGGEEEDPFKYPANWLGSEAELCTRLNIIAKNVYNYLELLDEENPTEHEQLELRTEKASLRGWLERHYKFMELYFPDYIPDYEID